MRRTLEDTILRTLWTIGVSTLFSRMALELIHDTLTHLTVPLIFWEMALPVVGVLVAELAPEKTGDFIQVRIARLPPPTPQLWQRAHQPRPTTRRPCFPAAEAAHLLDKDKAAPASVSADFAACVPVRSWQRRGVSSASCRRCRRSPCATPSRLA